MLTAHGRSAHRLAGSVTARLTTSDCANVWALDKFPEVAAAIEPSRQRTPQLPGGSRSG